MSHSSTSRRGTTRRRRRASRIGSPAVRRLPAQRAAHVDPLAMAIALARAACVATAWRCAAASSADTAAQARRARASRSAWSEVPLLRWRAWERGSSCVRSAGRSGRMLRRVARDGGVVVVHHRSCFAAARWTRLAGSVSGTAGTGPYRIVHRGRSEHTEESVVERAHLRAVGDERRPRGPVQPAARDRLDHGQRLSEPGSALRRHRHTGVVEPAAERSRDRGQVEARASAPGTAVGRVIEGSPARPAPRRGSRPGPRST